MPPHPRRKRFWGTILFCAALGFALVAIVRAQPGTTTHFTLPEFYPPPHQERLKTLVTGAEAQSRPDNTYLLKGLKIQLFRDSEDTNAEITLAAPNCLFDERSHDASSPGALQIISGDGKLKVEGEGFLWHQIGTNSTLIISNNVHTTIRREFLKQTVGGTNAAVAPPPSSSSQATNEIELRSERLLFDRQANTITYSGNVRAEDNDLSLNCDTMTIRRATNGTIDNIVADRNVVVITKATGGRTTGDHAVYTAVENRQDVELTGNPRYLEGSGREGSAKVFVFDRLHNTLLAEGDAWLKIPRNSIGKSGALLPSQPDATPPATGATNQFVEIYSDTMTFQLPPTNGPLQSVTADHNVVILDPERNSRATGDRASYSEATGLLELEGHAMWQADQRVAKAAILVFDRNNQTFSARTNAYLKLPAATFGKSLASARPSTASTNQFLEIICDRYDYADELLTFRNQVHAAFAQDDAILAMLDCATLRAAFKGTNQLQGIQAEGEVYARMLPARNARGSTIERDLKCDTLDLTMTTNGTVDEIVADGKVLATQTETRPNTPLPVHVSLNSDRVTASFRPATNAIDRLVADGSVLIRRDDMTARGAKGVYTASNDVAQLTGSPVIASSNMTLTGSIIILDHANNKFQAKNAKITVNAGTNKFGLKLPGIKRTNEVIRP